MFIIKTEEGEFEIPDTVEVIGKGAFAGCVALEEVIGGKGVKEIRSNAFDRCENLHKIPDLLNGVEECGIYAFRGCKNLEVTERRHLTEEVIFQTCSYYTKR